MEPIWIMVAAGAALLVVLFILIGRRRERVIAAPSAPGSSASPVADADAPAAGALDPTDKRFANVTSPGDILEIQGQSDAECGLADWLMHEANQALGVDLRTDRMALTRLAEAAVKASAELKATGRATINLPLLVADAAGPKHFHRTITRDEAEPHMIALGALLVDEIMQWRGRDERHVALAEWLETEAEDEAGEPSLDPQARLRLANATEQALADFARYGRAVVDLPGLTKDDGTSFHFHREYDRETLESVIGEA